MLRRLSAAALLLALGACTVGPNFEPPEWLSPASWFAKKAEPITPAPSMPVAEPIDPELVEPVQRSDAHRRWNAASPARTWTCRSPPCGSPNPAPSLAWWVRRSFPTLNANGSYTRQKASDVGVFANAPNALGANGASGSNIGGIRSSHLNAFDVYQVGFDASWELDLWGKVRRSVESADRLGGGVGRGAAGTRCSATWPRSRATTSSCAARSRCCGSRATTSGSRSRASQLTQQRATGGVTTDLDVANAAAQLRTTAAEIPRLEQQESELINAISLLLGQPPNALQAELIRAKPVPPVPPRVPVGLPSELARRRPDIRQAEAQLHAATADIGVAVANFYPSVKLSGSLGLQAIQPWKMFNIDARNYAVGPGVTIPIFEGGQLKATLELRKAQQQEAAITYQKTVLSAWHEVDNALTAYQTEQARRDQLIQAVAQNQRALGLAQSRYQEGVADFLQVLTAQQNLLSTQQQLALATTNVSANLVALYKALGGGWETQLPAANDDLSPIGAPHL